MSDVCLSSKIFFILVIVIKSKPGLVTVDCKSFFQELCKLKVLKTKQKLTCWIISFRDQEEQNRLPTKVIKDGGEQ